MERLEMAKRGMAAKCRNLPKGARLILPRDRANGFEWGTPTAAHALLVSSGGGVHGPKNGFSTHSRTESQVCA